MKLEAGKEMTIETARHLEGCRLEITFSDGLVQTIDFEPFLQQAHPELRKYLDEKEFAQFSIKYGNILWNDCEMCFPIKDLYSGNLLARESELNEGCGRTRALCGAKEVSSVNYRNLNYNSPSPSSSVLKAMDSVWADELLHEGKVRIHSNKYYRDIEDDKTRDPEEGVGVFNYNGNLGYTDGLMSTYILCTSQSQIEPKELASKFKRDAVVHINQPEVFAKRLLEAAYRCGGQWGLDCEPVKYDKRSFRDRHPTEDGDDANDFYLFQKDQLFSHEKEYRFALTDLMFFSSGEEFVDLQMEPCHDIIGISKYWEKVSTAEA